MSLKPDDRSSRSRSKSPARSRERSRSNVRASDLAQSNADPRYTYAVPANAAAPAAGTLPIPGAFADSSASTPQFEVRQPSQSTSGPSSYAPPANGQYISPSGAPDMRAPSPGPPSSNITMGDYADLPRRERPGYMQQQPQPQYPYGQPQARELSQQQTSPTVQYAQPLSLQNLGWNYTVTPRYQAAPPPQPGRKMSSPQYPSPGSYQYAPPPSTITYTAKPITEKYATNVLSYMEVPQPQAPQAHPQSPTQAQPFPPFESHPPQPQSTDYAHGRPVKEVAPGGGKLQAPPSPGMRPHRLSVNGPRPDVRAPPSPGLAPRMDRLSVSGNRPDIPMVPGQAPPASPLLEAYHGTYQSISPMPSPMILPHDDIDDLPPLSPRVSNSSVHRHSRSASTSHAYPAPPSPRPRKRVILYDAESDARAIAEELSCSHPDMGVLIDILPTLSHDQLMELRNEYKRVCKIQGRGINIAKHIKLKTPSGNFGKICYVTALGRWESEGYWANYWYQSNSSRRELLIEALMGRSNAEIRAIKDGFRDKRYGDSLARCMDKELKADKFRAAVLLALEESRQEEGAVWPVEYRNRDVDALFEALRRREGGESAIINIVVTRSDAHLRDVLRTYERKYQGNFAREALRKSNNLVGEVIAHILNGVINRPARDALLLHHALDDLAPSSSKDSNSKDSKHERKDRYELLISRLVRLHWDQPHLMRVKEEYRDKYRRYLEEDIEDYVKGGDFREFCLCLCEGRR